MIYYPKTKSYMSGLKLAAEDEAAFNDSERNALRGAIQLLVVQDERILENQKNVGDRNADAKFELQNYTVFFGFEKDGGVCVEVKFCPDNFVTEYYLVGVRPIKLIWPPTKMYEALKYDWSSGNFIEGDEYIADIFFSTSDVEQIAEDVFLREVENLKAKRRL
ncbi:hypothetical protein [Clostridium sp. C2-6-12]|uniref:hypothetical protein n=1 Tax=Clostridium sp. C2-6-12 TaxID=2698832 RepID=UPI00136FC1B3|nr:hypothetical protein [Clostridium sp. C2-6-12]